MDRPIVYVDRSEIAEGRSEEVRARIGQLAAFVDANEPQVVSYGAYLDADGRTMSVVHVHRDPASLATHLRVAGPLFGEFRELVRLRSIDIYGDPPDAVVGQLRDKARLLGDATVTVHPFAAGFVRGVSAPVRST